MRAAALALVGFVTIGAVAGFAGCGGGIETTATGGHGGSAVTSGTGGTATSTATNVTAVSGTGGSTSVSSSANTSVTSSTSSTGGVDMACQAACNHIDSCMLQFSCADISSFFNCANINSADDCIFDCVANTPCSSIGISTLQTCQAACKDGGAATTSSSSATSSVASSSGTMANSCQQCSVQSCQSPLAACAVNTACRSWLECVQPCNQATPLVPACFAACDMANAGASALYGPVYTCACSMCTTECGSIPECGDAGP